MSEPVPFGTVEPFEANYTLAGVPILNATGVTFIRRNSDNKYLNVSDLWQDARVSRVASEVGETNSAGDWRFLFDTSLGLASDIYKVENVDTSGNSDNPQEAIEFKVGFQTDSILTNQANIEAKVDTSLAGIVAIDAKTTNLPADPASEAAATTNKASIITEIDANEVKIDAVKAKTDNLPSDPTSETNASNNKAEIIAEIGSENDDAEAAAVGKADYNKSTSILTLFKKDQPAVIHKQFNCKDKDGNPAKENPIFAKIPF